MVGKLGLPNCMLHVGCKMHSVDLHLCSCMHVFVMYKKYVLKRNRCGKCQNCKRKNCGLCLFCRYPYKKKPCALRKCLIAKKIKKLINKEKKLKQKEIENVNFRLIRPNGPISLQSLCKKFIREAVINKLNRCDSTVEILSFFNISPIDTKKQDLLSESMSEELCDPYPDFV